MTPRANPLIIALLSFASLVGVTSAIDPDDRLRLTAARPDDPITSDPGLTVVAPSPGDTGLSAGVFNDTCQCFVRQTAWTDVR